MTKILLVEDNPLNQDMLSRRLKRQSYEVVIAVDGAAALSMAKTEDPDVILMDMNIPIIDGWEATRRLKADVQTQKIPVIALTAYAMKGDREKAIAAGCDDYATKPVEFKQLLKTLRAFAPRPTAPQRLAAPFAAKANAVASTPAAVIPETASSPAPTAGTSSNGTQSPVSAAPAISTAAQPAADLPFTLLVVNDNVTNREILSAHLQRRGYTVVKVDSPSATLDVLNQFSIDLVLLDIMVPESGNFNLLQQIRKTHRKTDLAVILITINDSDEAVVKAFDAGANDYVSKPINLAIVMARIKSQLETLQANRQLRSDLQAAPTPPSVSTSLPAAPPPAATPPVITPPVITPPVTAPPVTAQVSTTPQLATSTSPTLAEASTQSSQVLQTNDPAPVAGKALSNASSEHSNPTQAPSTRATGTFAFSYKPYFLGHTFSKTPFSQIKLAQRPSELEAVPKSPPKSPPESPLCFVETFFLNNTNEASLNKLRTLLELEKSRLASISQNNCILSLVDFFENDQVFGWYQNYVEGRLFAEELSTGQIFSVQKVLKTIKALLEMLLPFHTRKIVHASLQPQHLWRCSEDEELRLLSLGLSRRLLNHLREQAASDHTATHLPAFNHEHDYMPVEQRIGQAVLSSDLYSVGLIALQMLTGKPLSVLTNSLIASESSLEQLALVPADIQPLLAKMVAQDPQSRYPSALAALRGLNELVSVRSQ